MVNRKRQAWYNKGARPVTAAAVVRRTSSKTGLRVPLFQTPSTEDASPVLGYKSGSLTEPPDSVPCSDYNSNDLHESLSTVVNTTGGANILNKITDTNVNESSVIGEKNCGVVNSCYMEIDDSNNSCTESRGATPTRDESGENWMVIDNDTGGDNVSDTVTSTSVDDGVFVDSGVESITTATTIIDEVGVCHMPSDPTRGSSVSVSGITRPSKVINTDQVCSDRSMSEASRGSSRERHSKRYGSVESNHSNTTLSSDRSNNSTRNRSPTLPRHADRRRSGRSDGNGSLGKSRSKSRDRKRRKSKSPESNTQRHRRLRATYPDGSAYPSGSSSKTSTSSHNSNSKRRTQGGKESRPTHKSRSSSTERRRRVLSPRQSVDRSSTCSDIGSVSSSKNRRQSLSPKRQRSSFTDNSTISDTEGSQSTSFSVHAVEEGLQQLRKESETRLDISSSDGTLVGLDDSLCTSESSRGDSIHRRRTRSPPVRKISSGFPSSTISVTKGTHSDRMLAKKSFSKGTSSHYSRAKSVYNARSKVTGTSSGTSLPERKSQKDVAKRLSQAKMLDGVGIQKIRVTHQRAFMKQYVEENYFEPDGPMSKGMKPLMAFKIGNPQFVSEFLEKKTEMMNADSGQAHVQKTMKEKFVYKVKIGEENLDKFITEGLTANGQNEFFLQNSLKYVQQKGKFKNAVLLYRHADVCLAWVRGKEVPKHKPIFLLISKVIYGRAKTYSHLSDKQFIKPDYKADMLKVSTQMMRRPFYDDEERIRYALSCSKAIFTDISEYGLVRDRPRQILPYAIVLYTKADYNEDVQADLKQVVLRWKENFEMQRWQMMRQQRAAVAVTASPSVGLLSARLPLPPATRQAMESITAAENTPQLLAPGRRTQALSANLEPLGPRVINGGQLAPGGEMTVANMMRASSERNSGSVSPVKKSRFESPAQKEDEIDKIVEEIVASRKAAIKTVSVGVQVKTQTILSLQKKSVSLTASTQTPNIDTEDSYEAMLLRGGPIPPIPPPSVVITTQKIVCSKCNGHLNAGQANPTETPLKTTVKLSFENKNERKREHRTLSARFSNTQGDFDQLFEDEDEEETSQLTTRGAVLQPPLAPPLSLISPAEDGAQPKVTEETLNFLSTRCIAAQR